MPISIFIVLAGSLFLLKMTYILCTALHCTALVLPKTQIALHVSTSRVRIAAFMEAVPMKPEHLLIDLGYSEKPSGSMA